MARELAKALNMAKTTILRRAERETWPHQTEKNRMKYFLTEGLPEDIRLSLALKTRDVVPTENTHVPSLYKGSTCIVPVGSPELPDWQNRIALARADLIRAYLAEKALAKSRKESIVRAGKIFIKGYNTGQLFPQLYKILGTTSTQTMERLVKRYRDANYDYAVLATGWGKSRGQRKITDHEFDTALSFILQPNRLRVSEVTRLTKLALKKRGIPSPSCDATIRRSLSDWKKTHYDQWVFCREGEKALNDKVLPYIERDAGLLDVGEILVADGHVLNFQVLHPFTGKPCRMTMVAWYDWASCMPVGWEIMPTENIQCVAAGLRRAILTLGKMPKVAYLDNGKAFKARVFTDTAIDFEEAGFYGMFARLGIETIFAWPYNAQSKPVERFFGTFNELERLMPTYTGASITDKPAHILRNEKLHRKIHEKKYGGWVPTVEETNEIIAGWVAEYSRRPHQGLKGLQPGEVLHAGLGPGMDARALRYLMMSMEIKSVRQNGIRFMGRNYYDPALYGYKDRVVIKYDLEDLSRIVVYDSTGTKEICEATPVQATHPAARLLGDTDDLAAVTAGIKRKRSLKKATEKVAREYVETMPELVAIPARAVPGQSEKGMPIPQLPQAEAERIEAEAAKMKVLELKPKTEDPLYMNESDRYETYLETECTGGTLSLEEMQFMRYFEKTRLYTLLKERFDFLSELWIAGPEEEEAI